MHASRKAVSAANVTTEAPTAGAEPGKEGEDEDDDDDEEHWTEHMGEADALRDHADGSAWAVMWLAGQDAVDMEAASDADVAAGISQVCCPQPCPVGPSGPAALTGPFWCMGL